MRCPFCDAEETKVIDTRVSSEGFQVRRRRQCLSCNERFTTFEHPEITMPTIIKSNGIKRHTGFRCHREILFKDPDTGSSGRAAPHSKIRQARHFGSTEHAQSAGTVLLELMQKRIPQKTGT